jgi:arabinose-5-phosphate isomerase
MAKAKLDIIKEVKSVINKEIEILDALFSSIDDKCEVAVKLIEHCRGKIIVTGVGKSALVGKKISSTLCSLGTPSTFMHSNDALHGDLGLLTASDILLVISHSGETEEVKNMFPVINEIGLMVISITGNKDSFLAKNSDVTLLIPVGEADHMDCAPTASTTATMVLGDAIAVAASMINEFDENDFRFYHPGGTLGKR